MKSSITSHLSVGAGRALVLPATLITTVITLGAIAWSPGELMASQQDSAEEPALRRVPLDQEGGSRSRLQRIPVEDDPTDVDRDLWRQRLSANDLDLRERAYDDLIERARTDDRLIKMLREWSDAPADNDIAWTSRLALRELEGTRSASPYTQSPFTEQLRRSEVFGDSFFRGLDAFGQDFQQDFQLDFQLGLDSLFHELREFEDVVVPRGAGTIQEESRKVELRVEPSGVTCEVTECIDGKEVTEEFQADSLDELIEKHPELKEHVEPNLDPLESGRRLFEGGLDSLFGSDLFRELDQAFNQRGMSSPFQRTPPRTDILGIRYTRPDASRVDATQVEPGQGLWVESIEPGTIAAEAGLKRGDLVIEIDGRRIFAGQDVSDALAARGEFDELRILVLGIRGDRRELIWQPPGELR